MMWLRRPSMRFYEFLKRSELFFFLFNSRNSQLAVIKNRQGGCLVPRERQANLLRDKGTLTFCHFSSSQSHGFAAAKRRRARLQLDWPTSSFYMISTQKQRTSVIRPSGNTPQVDGLLVVYPEQKI